MNGHPVKGSYGSTITKIHKQLRMLVVLGMLFGMLAPLAQPATTYAALVTSTKLTGGVLINGVYYAKSGSLLTLTVSTDAETKCVELTGDHSETDGSAPFHFEFNANTGNGLQTVTATAYKGINPNGKCVANKGETTGPQSVFYTLDNIGPVVKGTLVPTANGAGWNNSDVTIQWTATDPSGATNPADQTVTASTVKNGVTMTATAKDALGNEGTGSVLVKLDKDLPTITATHNPAANTLGWNNSDVTVSFTCSDALSGIKSCTGGGTHTFSKEGADQSVSAAAVDNADNSAIANIGAINIDKTAPTLSGTPSATGWSRGDVTVTWSANDALSGLTGAVPADSTVAGEGDNLSASASVSDLAGNTTSKTVSGIKIDRTAPSTGISGTSNDWGNGDVTVTLSPDDALSGSASTFYTVNGSGQQTGTSFLLSDEGEYTVTYWSTDNAGNVEAAKSAQVKIDKTAPTIGHTFTPDTYKDGAWTNQNVTVTFVCADQGGSDVASCTEPVTKTDEGKGQQVTGTATDGAGNSASDTATVNIDKTPPTITAGADRMSNGNGWYKDDVTISFETSDALSGVASNPASTVLAEGANQSHSGAVTDYAGNSASATVSGINIDKTAPTLSGTPSATGWSRGDVTVTWSANDALSGLTGAVPADSTVAGEGDNLSASASVSDLAGNTTSKTVSGIKIDRTAPSTSVSVPEPLGTGWYASDVLVTLTAVDSLSGIDQTYYSVDGGAAQTYHAPFTFSQKGEHTITYWSTDIAGNVEQDGAGLTLKLDGTPPVTTISLPVAFATGWYADEVTVSFTVTDLESGVAKTYYRVDDGAEQEFDGTFKHTLDGTHTINFWSVDVAGNIEAAKSQAIKVDTSAPTITGSRTPAANGFGWNNTDVTVSFVCADSQSGVAIENCTPSVPVINEGAGQSVTGTATDNVNKTATTTVGDINIDKTAPTLAPFLETAANAAGWNKGDVTIGWTGTDTLSGIDPATQPADSVVTGEGDNLGATATIKDKAGNTGNGSVTGIKIDRTKPVVSGATVNDDGSARTANAAGWFNSAVRVRYSATDALSGVQETSGDTVLLENGANQNATGSASDKADNIAYTTVTGINIDSQAPQTSANNVCDGKNGWCKGQTATVNLTAVDQAGLSGVKEIRYVVNGGQEKVAAGASTSVNVPLAAKSGLAIVEFFAVDNAGNAEAKGGVSLKYDNIAPTVTHTVNPAANAAGWNNADTTVHFDAKDDDGGSGVDTNTVTPDVTVSAETSATGRVVNGSASDLVGNIGTDSVTVKLDRTAPTITAAVKAGTKGANGFYTGPVTVGFTCTDALSTVATCPADVVLNTDGLDQKVSGTAVDKAGNEASTTLSGINIDSTKPVITVSTVKASYTLGAAIGITCTATDATSGVDANDCKVTTSGGTANGVGTFTYTATATDKAGNVETITGQYKVLYAWNGFLQPINDTAHQVDQGVSIFKGGSTVPAKFQLKNAAGQIVQAGIATWTTPSAGAATSAAITEEAYSLAATSGGTYKYDAVAQQYIYNWSTKGLKVGLYYRIGVTLDDGQIYSVSIGLR